MQTLHYILECMQPDNEWKDSTEETRLGSQTIQFPLHGEGPECTIRVRLTGALVEKIRGLEQLYISRVRGGIYSGEKPLGNRKASNLLQASMEQLIQEAEVAWRHPRGAWQPIYYPHQMFVQPLASQMLFMASHNIALRTITLATPYLDIDTIAALAPRS